MLSVQFDHSVMSDSLRPHGLQHAWLLCLSPTPGACSNSCSSSWLCHPTISSSVVPFFSCLQYERLKGNVIVIIKDSHQVSSNYPPFLPAFHPYFPSIPVSCLSSFVLSIFPLLNRSHAFH